MTQEKKKEMVLFSKQAQKNMNNTQNVRIQRTEHTVNLFSGQRAPPIWYIILWNIL